MCILNNNNEIITSLSHKSGHAGCKAKLIYAVTPEFTSHLLTFVLPQDNDDPVRAHREKDAPLIWVTSESELFLFLSFFCSLSFFSTSNSERFCSGGGSPCPHSNISSN